MTLFLQQRVASDMMFKMKKMMVILHNERNSHDLISWGLISMMLISVMGEICSERWSPEPVMTCVRSAGTRRLSGLAVQELRTTGA